MTQQVVGVRTDATLPARTTPTLVVTDVTGDEIRAVVHWPHTADREGPTLTELVAVFTRLGLIVADHRHEPGTGIHHVSLRGDASAVIDDATAASVAVAFGAITAGDTDLDGFLRLVTTANLSVAEVTLVRALTRYARQCGLHTDLASAAATLASSGLFVRALLALFRARLQPGVDDRDAAIAAADAGLDAAIGLAASGDEDRLMRMLTSVVRATLRTNWFADGVPAAAPLALKIDPGAVDLPASVAVYREIFVHGSGVEGSHLRGGPTARGGLRWSERPDDFRTEVLGLMRTQMVKNSLIVPVGAKGAFVVRGSANPGPDAVRVAYAQFIGALLDVTDNLVDGTVVHPRHTVITDGPDPYLVVAADKGTARYSDLANSIASSRGYWLGDAFASGGSAGYDHKAMGITARGTWLAVRRHLAEAGIDVDADDFTVAGIGDMSGDVFGNGMCASRRIRLVAAFDHRHIFLDPDPDAAATYAERLRLFELPGGTWANFDRSVLSPGGGVWSRSAKSIEISDAARRRLGIAEKVLTPAELIRAILRARVDLLFNGGVGTYVKASTETSAQAADPGNEAVRVDADTLRATVIGEGGNLGMTQRARVEFALAGGRVNADFIDNAGGVASSDREVNIKIALDDAVAAGKFDVATRNAMLAAATDEVADAVLADCDRQTLALSLAEKQSSFLLGRHARLIENLEETTGIDRAHEVLPSGGELAARLRAGTGLVRPEIAVLLAMSKNVVRAELLASSVPDDPALAPIAANYFPASMRAAISAEISGHRLRREIVAVRLANDVIDHVGPGFVHRLEQRYGVDTPAIVRAYAIATGALRTDTLWAQAVAMEELGMAGRFELLAMIQSLIEQATSWVLRHRRSGGVGTVLQELAPQLAALRATLPRLTGAAADRETLTSLAQAFGAVRVAESTGLDVVAVAQANREVGRRLHLDRFAAAVDAPATTDWWEAMAAATHLDDLADVWQQLAATMLAGSQPAAGAPAAVDAWVSEHRAEFERVANLVDAHDRDSGLTCSRTVVVLAALRRLAACGGSDPIGGR